MTPLLSIQHLSITFNTPDGTVQAVQNIDLAIHAGETLAIVGESGAGKSQIFQTVMGLLPANAVATGSITFADMQLLGQSMRVLNQYRGKRMAIIFQDPMTSLNPLLSIGRQLTEILEVHQGLSAREARLRSIAMLKQVRIPDAKRRFNSYPHELSGGMRQRVMIAMALLCEPDLLIADEPTTALDVTVQSEIMALLREIQSKRNMAIILITHDLPLAGGLCDTIAVMSQGKLVEQGRFEQVIRHPEHTYTRQLLAALQHSSP